MVSTRLVLQVDDLLGMQNANILNLPENYTFKYCKPCSNLPNPTSPCSCHLPLFLDLYHALTWPELSYVAVSPKGEIVGYILAKMSVLRHTRGDRQAHHLPIMVLRNRDEEAVDIPSGHVTSISVLRPYRRLGLANKLMRQSRRPLCSKKRPCSACSLHSVYSIQRNPWHRSTTPLTSHYTSVNQIERPSVCIGIR